jgi:iron-sulfur cluster repair protein YtfE (RIC family)
MDVLEHLIEEHRKAEQLIANLAASQPGLTRASVLAELSDALDLHMEVEERDVYPIVQQQLGGPRAEAADQEHNDARELLSRLADRLDEPDFDSTVQSLSSAIGHHVAVEENEIFPALRKRAPAEIAALGDAEQNEDEIKEQLADESRPS